MAMTEPQKPTPPEIRISDDERQMVVKGLQDAAAANRLDLDELGERLAMVYHARTRADLEPIVADLPIRLPDLLPAAGPQWPGAVDRRRRRRGSLALWGSSRLDLGAAMPIGSRTTLAAIAIFGNIDVVVPVGTGARFSLINIFGRAIGGSQGPPDGPEVVIAGLVLFGTVRVVRRPSP
jgi:hypothetical protein